MHSVAHIRLIIWIQSVRVSVVSAVIGDGIVGIVLSWQCRVPMMVADITRGDHYLSYVGTPGSVHEYMTTCSQKKHSYLKAD